MGQSGGKRESVEHLGDTSSSLVGLSLVAPVASSKGVLETICDGPGFDG